MTESLNIRRKEVYEFFIKSEDFKTFRDFTRAIRELLGGNFSNTTSIQDAALRHSRKGEHEVLTYPSGRTFSGWKFYEFEGRYGNFLPTPLTLFCDGKISPEEGDDFCHELVYLTPELLSQNPRFVAISGYSGSVIEIIIESYHPYSNSFELDEDGNFIDDVPAGYQARVRFEGPKGCKGTYYNAFFKGVTITEKLLAKK